jgi:hypothetical protein
MAKYQARKLVGAWKAGYVLDLHTVSSIVIGHNEFGHPQFDTTYSEVGGLLNRLKYRSDKSTLPELVETAASLIRSWGVEFTAIVPVPPTKVYRTFQPVLALASELANVFKVPMLKSAIRKAKQITELKNLYDADERKRLLKRAFEGNPDGEAGSPQPICGSSAGGCSRSRRGARPKNYYTCFLQPNVVLSDVGNVGNAAYPQRKVGR